MAKPAQKKTGSAKKPKAAAGKGRWRPGLRVVWRWLWRLVAGFYALVFVLLVLFRFINPPTTPYILSESFRLGHVQQRWVPMSAIAPVMARSVVAAEDANFCLHWGFDMAAIRAAIAQGANRGGSTIDQQVVKNVFLWQGRSWPRKALEALITPVMELVWPKRRILEIYLNVAEFDDGVFGIAAGAASYFHAEPDKLTAVQAARLAVMLPDPKDRDAARPTAFVRERAAAALDGADTIHADGRDACFKAPPGD